MSDISPWEGTLKEIDETLARCKELTAHIVFTPDRRPPASDTKLDIGESAPHGRVLEARMLLEQTIHRLAPTGSKFEEAFEEEFENTSVGAFEDAAHFIVNKVSQYTAILRAMRFDFERGRVRTFEDVVRRDLFDDELEIATYLLGEGFLDSADVTAGVVLEAHLRKMARNANIEVRNDRGKFLRAERLNEELRKAGIYDHLEQSSVTTMLTLRNAGSHPEDRENLTKERVGRLIEDVRSFLSRHPA